MTDLTVICARPDGQNEAAGPPVQPVLEAVAGFSDQVHFVGRFPSKDIDPLLVGRVVVIGEINHLAAVVLRMVRRGLLGTPESGPPATVTPIGFVPMARDGFSRRWQLPVGVDAVELACTGDPHPVPFLRDDAGGVLLGHGEIDSPTGTGYVDEHQILAGSASRIVVRPDPAKGLSLTVERARVLRLPPRRRTTEGRAFSVGFAAPTVVVCDGIPRPRPVPRWNWYAHTEPMHLARPA